MPVALDEVLESLERTGLLLLQDRTLPSLVGLVAGGPVRGSWWSHARSHEIFRLSERLTEHPDVTTAKLVSGKVTFVHRMLWRALVTVGGAREDWQVGRLDSRSRSLLERVDVLGRIQMGHLKTRPSEGKKVRDAALKLEKRLLVHGGQAHTDFGAHAKVLESWTRWQESTGVSSLDDVREAKHRIEDAVDGMVGKRLSELLPWPRQAEKE